ncbi:MAG: hypothetical protein IKQ69_03950 [Oscillospiraceae bacterium]|nr:hypothetical protein [Oscillospiraceae bacterium]
MSLTDSIRKKKNRPVYGADPAQAFGAEEQTMEEIRRQTFVPPEKKGPGLAQRAGAALSSLRTRIVGEEPAEEGFDDYAPPQQTPAEEAPVYSARNYQSEDAPDLGWENPFTEPSPGKKGAASASGRARRPRSYATSPQQPYYPVYPEQPQGYNYAPYPAQTSYEGAYPEGAGYPQDVYGQQPYPYQDGYAYEPEFYGSAPGYTPTPEYWQDDPSMQETYGYPDSYPEEQSYYPDNGNWYGPDNMPLPRRRTRPKTDPGDFKYMFWSGGIVLGMVLTVASFIYGCLV